MPRLGLLLLATLTGCGPGDPERAREVRRAAVVEARLHAEAERAAELRRRAERGDGWGSAEDVGEVEPLDDEAVPFRPLTRPPPGREQVPLAG